jgi:hypothetical protein
MAGRPDDEGVDLSPDEPMGVPATPGAVTEPAPMPMPGEGGVIAPGPTPESR